MKVGVSLAQTPTFLSPKSDLRQTVDYQIDMKYGFNDMAVVKLFDKKIMDFRKYAGSYKKNRWNSLSKFGVRIC